MARGPSTRAPCCGVAAVRPASRVVRVHEILKQVGWLDELPQAGHFRTKDGLEVDLVLELFDERVAAVEVKAGTVVRAEDCRGLAALRDRWGSLFIGGVVLHTGELAYQLADRLFAVPIDQLWTPPEAAR